MKLWLIAIIILGIVLRIAFLGQESLWMDETYSLVCSSQSGDAFFTCLTTAQSQPPLYFILLSGWISLFGESEEALRSLSVIFSIAALPFIYLLARHWFKKKTASLALVFGSITFIQIFYAQEARPYALFMCLTVLTTYVLMKLFSNNRHWPMYLASMILLVYTHYFAWFVVAFHMILAFLSKKRMPFIMISLAFLSYLPWLPTMARGIWFDSRVMLGALTTKFGLPAVLASTLFFGIPLFSGISIAGIIWINRTRLTSDLLTKSYPQFRSLPFIFIILHLSLLPFIIHPLFLTRYLFFLSPFVAIIMAKLLVDSGKRPMVIGSVIIVIISLGAIGYYYAIPSKEEWSAVADAIPDGEKVIINDADLRHALHYYDPSLDVLPVGVGINEGYSIPRVYDKAEDEKRITEFIADEPQIFLIHSHHYRAEDLVPPLLSDFTLAETTHYQGITLYKYLNG
ncbi:MAG: glycosyltransferase family 39 protein [Nanoarchaeota archaeon]